MHSDKKTQSFCDVNFRYQNGIAEKIRTIISLARAMLFNAMIKCPSTVHLGLWPCAAHHAVDVLNNMAGPSGLLQNKYSRGVKGDRSFRGFHTFGSPIFALNLTLHAENKLSSWKPHASPCTRMGKSRHHASNVLMVFDSRANCIKPQFHEAHDEEFQTVAPNSNNCLLKIGKLFLMRSIMPMIPTLLHL